MLDTGLSMTQALKNVLIDIKGIYNIIIQTPAGLYLMRDRFGVRPFYYGTKTNNIIVVNTNIIIIHVKFKYNHSRFIIYDTFKIIFKFIH